MPVTVTCADATAGIAAATATARSDIAQVKKSWEKLFVISGLKIYKMSKSESLKFRLSDFETSLIAQIDRTWQPHQVQLPV